MERVKLGGLIALMIEPEKELVFGIAGRFWLPTVERVSLDSAEDFAPMVGSFSGLVRLSILRQVRRSAESRVSQSLPA